MIRDLNFCINRYIFRCYCVYFLFLSVVDMESIDATKVVGNQCPVCQKIFNRRDAVYKHLRTQHRLIVNLKSTTRLCPRCGHQSKKTRQFDLHKANCMKRKLDFDGMLYNRRQISFYVLTFFDCRISNYVYYFLSFCINVYNQMFSFGRSQYRSGAI